MHALVGKIQGPAHLPLWQCSPMHGRCGWVRAMQPKTGPSDNDLASYRSLIGEPRSVEGTSHMAKPHRSRSEILLQFGWDTARLYCLDSRTNSRGCPLLSSLAALCCVGSYQGHSFLASLTMTSPPICHSSSQFSQRGSTTAELASQSISVPILCNAHPSLLHQHQYPAGQPWRASFLEMSDAVMDRQRLAAWCPLGVGPLRTP
jgi:hypothetical protein